MRASAALAGLVAAEFLAAAGFYAGFGHVSYLLALYWAAETATTVGYGDVVPRTAGGHVTAAVTMLTVIPTVGALFGRLAAVHVVRAWHRKNADVIESAAAAHQIAADLYREHTGAEHPLAPAAGEAP